MSAATDREETGPRAGTGGIDDLFGRFVETADFPEFSPS